MLFQQGEVDAITGDDTVLAGLAAQDPYARSPGDAFTAEPYGLGFNEDHVDFVRFVNGVLEQMRSDGRWTAVLRPWLQPALGPAPAPPTPVYGRPVTAMATPIADRERPGGARPPGRRRSDAQEPLHYLDALGHLARPAAGRARRAGRGRAGQRPTPRRVHRRHPAVDGALEGRLRPATSCSLATWDSGRVGVRERERLATLIWGRLDAASTPPGRSGDQHGVPGSGSALAVSLPEACRLSDALPLACG